MTREKKASLGFVRSANRLRQAKFFLLLSPHRFGFLGSSGFGNSIGFEIEPIVLELNKSVAAWLLGILDCLPRGQRNGRISQGDWAIAARLVAKIAGADTPCPVLDFFFVTTTDGARLSRFGWCSVGAGCRVQYGNLTLLLNACFPRRSAV